MKFFTTVLAVILSIALVAGQRLFFGQLPSGGVQSQFAYNTLTAPAGAAPQLGRDPRQNRGPVVFPPSPPADDESSGVIIGASGFGFVPPQQTPIYYTNNAIDVPEVSYSAYNFYSDPYTQRFHFY